MRVTKPLDDLFDNPNNVRLLRHIIRYPSSVITGRGLARELGMSHATCIRSLNRLVNTGILDRRRVGKGSTYEIAAQSVLYREILKPALTVESALLPGLVDSLLQGVKRRVHSVYLFGSVARGEDTLSSDVDILVLTKDRASKAAVNEALAHNKGNAYRLYRVGVTSIVYDLDEFGRMKSKKSPLVMEILKEGVLLFGREAR